MNLEWEILTPEQVADYYDNRCDTKRGPRSKITCEQDVRTYPIRQKAAHTPRPASRFERHCATCGASFVALAPGTTGERGIWRSWVWYCSQECDRGEQRRWPA